MSITRETLETLRSLLFIPVTEPRFLQNIKARGAGAVILDLEDAVTPNKKAQARASLAAMRHELKAFDIAVMARINAQSMEDIDAAVGADVDAVLVPKVPGAITLQEAADRIKSAEGAVRRPVGKIKLLALIETPGAVVNLPDIARSTDSLVGLVLGGEDLCLTLGIEPSATGLSYAASRLVMSARAAGIVPLGVPGPLGLIEDSESFRESVTLGRQLGMAGAVCIHPRQVTVVNEVYASLAVSFEDARSIVDTFERAVAQGRGAVMWNGRMLDLPIVERARKIIAARC